MYKRQPSEFKRVFSDQLDLNSSVTVQVTSGLQLDLELNGAVVNEQKQWQETRYHTGPRGGATALFISAEVVRQKELLWGGVQKEKNS